MKISELHQLIGRPAFNIGDHVKTERGYGTDGWIAEIVITSKYQYRVVSNNDDELGTYDGHELMIVDNGEYPYCDIKTKQTVWNRDSIKRLSLYLDSVAQKASFLVSSDLWKTKSYTKDDMFYVGIERGAEYASMLLASNGRWSSAIAKYMDNPWCDPVDPYDIAFEGCPYCGFEGCPECEDWDEEDEDEEE